MSEQIKIKEISINTTIYDPELPKKIAEAFGKEIPVIGPNERFGIQILFDKSVYQQTAFYEYKLPREYKGRASKTEQEKAKQKVYDVLDEQLSKVTTCLKEIGYAFGDTAIIGDNLEDDAIHVTLYRREVSVTGTGKRQTEAHVNSIMPDRPFTIQQMSKAFARMFSEQMLREAIEEAAKKSHTPNWVPASEVFEAISAALSIEMNAVVEANTLVEQAFSVSDWPLHIRTKTKKDQAEPITGSTNIDCPEYMIFQLNHGESWDLKKVDNLKEAQQIISKQSFRYKQTKAIIVLHNLKEVPYSLFAETDEGLIPVTPIEACGHKKLHVSWQK